MAFGPKKSSGIASAGVLPAVVPVNKKKRGRPTTKDENNVAQAAAMPATKKAAASPATKKARGKLNAPASSKRYADVVAALREDDGLEPGVLEMLVNGCGESLLASSPTKLHSFQLSFLGFIEVALGRIELKFGANIADAQAAYDKLANAGKELEQAQQAASADFGASVEAMKVEEAVVESSSVPVDVAKGALAGIVARLSVSDLASGTAAMERHQLEVMLTDPSSAPVALLARLVPDCAEDSGLTFSELVGKVREAIALRNRTMQDGAAARIALHTTLEDARTLLGSRERHLADRRKALDDVSAIRFEKAQQLKKAWDTLRNLPEEQARTEAELKAAKKKLGDFQAGPMTTVRTVIQGPTSTAPPTPTPTPSVISAEIRRRRTSWLPRKVIAMRSRGSSVASKHPSADDDDSDGDVATTAQVSGEKFQKDAAAPGDMATAQVSGEQIHQYATAPCDSSRKDSTRKQPDLEEDGEEDCEQESITARLPTPSRRRVSLGTKE